MNAGLQDLDWRCTLDERAQAARADWFEAAPDGSIVTADPLHARSQGLLEARGLCAWAGSTCLLHSVDLQLEPGQVGAVLGPNGAGKSTLLSLLAGLRAAQAGDVLMNGRPVTPKQAGTLAQVRAVLPQDTAVAFDFTVREVVALGRYPHRLYGSAFKRITALVRLAVPQHCLRLPPCSTLECKTVLPPSRQEAQIVDAAMSLTAVDALAHRRLFSLSGGERARAQLARVLAQIWEPAASAVPRWLLVDEPTAALDLHHQHNTLNMLRRWAREQGVGVLAVLHDLNLALRYADRMWVLGGGRLHAQGEPAQVLTPELVQRVWRVPTSVVRSADGVPQLLMGFA